MTMSSGRPGRRHNRSMSKTPLAKGNGTPCDCPGGNKKHSSATGNHTAQVFMLDVQLSRKLSVV